MIAQSLTKGNEQWLPPLGGAIAHLHYPTHCSLLIATPTASVQLGGSGLSCGGGELIAYEGWASRLGPRPSRIRPWLSRLGPMGCQPSYGGSMRAVSPWALAFPQRVYGVVRAVFQNPPVCPVTARYSSNTGSGGLTAVIAAVAAVTYLTEGPERSSIPVCRAAMFEPE
jgi:hypothetical protein